MEQRKPSIGIEIADAATRLTAIRADGKGGHRRWQSVLKSPPSPETCGEALGMLIEKAIVEGDAAGLPRNDDDILCLGLAIAGSVDVQNGRIRTLPPLADWSDLPIDTLTRPLTQRLGHNYLRVESATTSAALAETFTSRPIRDLPLLYVSQARTVTSAYITGLGRLLRGAHGDEGQLGHWLVRADGPRCACGARGHLDPLASAQAIVRNTIGRASASDESTEAMLRISGGRAEAMSATQVVALAASGDPAATSVLDEALDALSGALANLATVLAPAVVVIGGPLAAAGDAYFGPLNARVTALCGTAIPAPPIIPATLEPRAALLGALLLADPGAPQ